MPKLYHADLFLPSDIRLPNKSLWLEYGRHAKEAILDEVEKHGDFKTPLAIKTAEAKLVEVEADGPEVLKLVYRQRLTEVLDIVLVVSPGRQGGWFVRTAWINLASDTHKTLNKGRYATR